MTDEDRRRMMEFILAQQAQFWAGMQRLEESQAKHEQSQKRADDRMNRKDLRIDRLERIVKLMIKAGQRARQHMRAQDERFERRFDVLMESQAHTDKRLDALVESQAHTDKRLDTLIDIVREQRNGST